MNAQKACEIFKKCSNMDDLYNSTENMTPKQKGDLWEFFAYYSIKLSPFLNKGLQEIWLYNDIPKDILKKLNLPKKDKGIDIIYKANNKYYAVQCKFRQNPAIVISWTELSTFFGLTFGVGENIKEGKLFTNTTHMCEEIIKSNKVKVIRDDYLKNNLPDSFFTNIVKSYKNIKLVEPTKKVPRDYQQKCIDLCEHHFVKDSKGIVVSACGSGKTNMAYWIDKILNVLLSGIFVPSLYLLNQIASEIIKLSYSEKVDLDILLIGSDNDIDEDLEFKLGGELNLTSDVDTILNTINTAKKNKTKLIIVCTYQSSIKLAEACKKGKVSLEFAIFDEAHRTVGQMGKQFNLMLDDANLIIKKRLFMTATPKIYGGKMEDNTVLSMDDEDYYGKQIFSYNTGEAIENKILVDYDIISLVCTNKDMVALIKKNKLVSFEKEFTDEESNYLATILMLLSQMIKGTCNHLLTYHNTISGAKKFADFLKKVYSILVPDSIYEANSICVDSFDGTTSMANRNKIIDTFSRSGKAILCTAKVLCEGINIPIIDSECFVDERNSTIDIVQCIGRSLRKHDKKTMSHIFIPTFIEDLDTAELNEKNFGNTIKILKSMKTTDNGISEYFSMSDNANKKMGRKIVKFEYVGKLTKSQEIKLSEWEKSVETKIWTLVNNYEFKKALLFEFVEKFKRIPTQTEEFNGVRVGRWLHLQKYNMKSTNDAIYKDLQSNQIIKKSIDKFLETREKNKDKIKLTSDEKIELLFEYVREHKITPKGSEVYKEYGIGQWFQDQKKVIISQKDEIYLLLSKNKVVKDELDRYLEVVEQNKDKKNFTLEESTKLFLEYVELNQSLPLWNKTYGGKTIGQWFNDMKKKIYSSNDEMYKILSVNKLVKENLDSYIKTKISNKEKSKLSYEEKFTLFLEFVKNNKRITKQKEEYKGEKLDNWFQDQKKKIKTIDDELYKKFSVNGLIKENIDTCLKAREEKKDKTIFTFEESVNLLFEYVNKNNEVPNFNTEYKKCKIGSFLSNIKYKMTSKLDNKYKTLSENKILKQHMDEFIKNKLKPQSDSDESEKKPKIKVQKKPKTVDPDFDTDKEIIEKPKKVVKKK
jgi:superfamily II DNA or RNA helicase